MNVITTNLSGVYVFEPKKFIDSRGYFMESYNKQLLKEYIGDINFVQDNESKSTYGVVRGLHFQKPPFAQAKLVRVVHGKVLDIAVDIRNGSPTFGQHFAIELSDENHRQLFIPRGFAHGFSVLSNEVVFQYKCDNYYQPSSEGAVLWNDSELNINWAIDNEHVILSDKDKNNSIFAELNSPFEF